MKRYLALIVCAVMLLGGCREGGYDLTSGYSRAGYDEFNVGEREYSSYSHKSSYSSSTVSSSSSESSRSSTVTSSSAPESSSSSVTSSSSSVTSTTSSTRSGISSGASSSTSSSSTVPAVTEVVPSSSEPTSLPEEPVQEQPNGESAPTDDILSDSGNVGGAGGSDMPANNDNIFEKPGESSSSTVSSPSASSTEFSEPEPDPAPEPAPEPEPEPETPVSPYDYEGTVYVAASGKGTKYHLNPNCSNMKGTVEMDVPEALAKGFTPCKKCWEV